MIDLAAGRARRATPAERGGGVQMADTVATLIAPGADLPPCDKRISELYRYWQSIRPAAGRLPGRQHFQPTDIPHLLQWIWLADVQRTPLRFKYRLVGEAHPRFRQSTAYPHFVAAAERAQVAFYRGPPVYVIDLRYKTIERLILPMAQDGATVDMLLGITVLDPNV